MIEQIKQALENANTPYRMCEDMGDVLDKNDNTVADFIYHDEDAHLIANAPEWLRYLIGEVERLGVTEHMFNRVSAELDHSLGQVEKLKKALEQIQSVKPNITSTQPHLMALLEAKRIADQALKGDETK